jgi:dTDP-4-amino-4,6-dideoxygalactose transaminase
MINTQSLPAVAGGEPIRTEFLVFGSPLIGEEEIAEVVDTMRSGWIGMGPKTARFEQEFAAYIGCPHAIAVNSATAALELALIAAGVGPGDEVITSTMTFAATANVVMHVGARPVVADIVRETQNIDPALMEAAISPSTRAVIPVHMAGRPCNMDAIMDIARRRKPIVIEDAAHAVETKWRAKDRDDRRFHRVQFLRDAEPNHGRWRYAHDSQRRVGRQAPSSAPTRHQQGRVETLLGERLRAV